MERQARGIALVCGPWGLSLCCVPWVKFARVAVREKFQSSPCARWVPFSAQRKRPESPYLVECAFLVLSRHRCRGEGGVLKKRSDWVGSVLRISLRVPSLSARRVPLPRGIPWVARGVTKQRKLASPDQPKQRKNRNTRNPTRGAQDRSTPALVRLTAWPPRARGGDRGGVRPEKRNPARRPALPTEHRVARALDGQTGMGPED